MVMEAARPKDRRISMGRKTRPEGREGGREEGRVRN
jgi:hypothetical protein